MNARHTLLILLALATVALLAFIGLALDPQMRNDLERWTAVPENTHVDATRQRTAQPLAPLPATESSQIAQPESAVSPNLLARLPLRPSLVATTYESSDTPSSTSAEASTWKRSELVANSAALMVGDDEMLPLEGMQLHAKIDGFRARVLLDLYFYNDNYSTLEGRLKLRLPEGATPFYLAFGQTEWEDEVLPKDHPIWRSREKVRSARTNPEDLLASRTETWIGPKEAKMVSRKKAAFAFRETVRREIDPAILQWAGPGMFSAAVYPIEPEQVHHIVVGYDVDLITLGDTLELRIDVPQDVPAALVDVDVAKLPAVAVTTQPAALGDTVDNHVFYRFEDVSGKALLVHQKVEGNVLLDGSDSAGSFFAAHLTPDIPASEEIPSSPRAVFVVDTSLSSNPDRFNVYLALLEAVLTNNRDSLQEFAVVFVDVEARWYADGFLANTKENVDALIVAANTLALEGATDVGLALREATSPRWYKSQNEQAWDVFFLSDASATWGEDDPHALAAILASGNAGPVFSYKSGLGGSDDALLAQLARQSGGALFSVTGSSEVAAASRAHRSRPWQLVDVTLSGGSDLLLSGAPRQLYPGQELVLVGRGRPDAEASAKFVLRRPGVETSSVLEAKFAHRMTSEMAPRVYGSVALSQLESLQRATGDVSEAYARHFRVTGPSASLLMLESEDDYLSYGIVPEDDTLVVTSESATARLRTAVAQIGESLGDPKARFLGWIGEMKGTEGLGFAPSEAFLGVLAAMPKSAFAAPERDLVGTTQLRSKLSQDLREKLASRTFSGDDLDDEAERRFAQNGADDGIKALSSLVEEHPGDSTILRDVGFRALEWGRGEQAYHLFKRVASARPWEPQTYHALALTLAELGHNDLALAYFEVGLAGQWDGRFGEFSTIMAIDYARFLNQVDASTLSAPEFAAQRRKEVTAGLELDEAGLLVTMTWNTDGTDVDLHVVEPGGEECFYSHPKTAMGGSMTRDVTQGYGPEMYVLPKTKAGKYLIKAKYYSSDSTRLTTRTKVAVTVYRNWGKSNETVERQVVKLESTGEVQEISSFEVK